MVTTVTPPSVVNVRVTFSPAFNAFFTSINIKCGPAAVSSANPKAGTVMTFTALSPSRSSIFPAASLVAAST